MEIGVAGWAAIASAVATASAASYNVAQSHHASKQQKNMAESQQNMALAEQQEQSREALKQRKELIDEQRASMLSTGKFATKTKQSAIADSGLRGKLGEDTLG